VKTKPDAADPSGQSKQCDQESVEKSSVEKADPSEQPPTEEKLARPERPGRLIFFASFCVLMFIIGLVCIFMRPSFPEASKIPVGSTISLFLSDENAKAKLSIASSQEVDQSARALNLNLEPTQPGGNVDWMIRITGEAQYLGTNLKDIQHGRTKEILISPNKPIIQQEDASALLIYGDLPSLSSTEDPLPSNIKQASIGDVGTISLPSFVSSDDAGTAARLPSIDEFDWQPGGPSYAIEFDRDTKAAVLGIHTPFASWTSVIGGPFDIDKRELRYPNADPKGYWIPSSMSSKMTWVDGAKNLLSQRIDSIIPPDGKIESSNIDWEASGSLSPTVSIFSRSAEQRKDTTEYISALSFGAAAAFFIAAVQEAWSRRRRTVG
jgi:hypothetical protein